MKTLLTLLTFFTSFFIRGFRWLSIVQQKEYKVDRLLLFIKTKQGRKELFRIFPCKTDFSRSGLKLPKITFRILLVSIIFFLQLLFLVYIVVATSMIITTSLGEINLYENIISLVFAFIILVIGLLITLFLIPLLVFIATIPITILSNTRS